MQQVLQEFYSLANPYYWRTAILIAHNNIARYYRNSFLGMLWTLLQPLTQVMVYSVIMPRIMRDPGSDYILLIVVSVPLWNFIQSILVQSCNSLLSQAETLKRCIVSSTLFPVSDVMRLAYIYVLSFGTMYVFCTLFLVPFHWQALLLPLYFVPILICMMAYSVAVAFVAPYVRDIPELLQVVMNVMFWMTPVVYPMKALPPAAQQLMQWNPFFILMHPMQELAYEHTLPSFSDHVHLLGLIVLSVAGSYAIYKKCRLNYVYYF